MSETPVRSYRQRGRHAAGQGGRKPRQKNAGRTAPLGAAPRLYERVVDILAAQIESGQLPAATRLQESGIATLFGVSRAPVRQALAELEQRGLIEKAASRGFMVRATKRKSRFPVSNMAPPDTDLRLVSSSSWERIYVEVESEIVARIAFGAWRVNEAELARSYGVSRTVARDVVGRLQQRGVLRKDERSRWYAPALTPDHVRELYEMRWVLEPVALVKAAPKLSPEFIAGLRAHLEEAIANAHVIGGAVLDQLETELHVDLLGHCGNQTLMQSITLHQSLLIAHRFLYRWTPRLFDTEPFLPEHLEIVVQLGAGHVEKAAKTLEDHLRISQERAIARVAEVIREFRPEELAYLEHLGKTVQ
jgi:DNA-binding GntR family transcriptional regulator